MTIEKRLKDLDAATAQTALRKLIGAYCTPAFGALPKREIDLLLFELILDLGLIPEDASIYELMRDLRVTRPKARSLIYDLEVRRAEPDSADLDNEVHELLKTTKFHKDMDYFVLEVEDPLLQDHLREKVRKLGYLSDGSFSSSIVKLPLPAVSALAARVMTKTEQETIRKALVAAGAPRKDTFETVLRDALGHIAAKVAGEATGRVTKAAVDEASEYLQPLFSGVADTITETWTGLFPKD